MKTTVMLTLLLVPFALSAMATAADKAAPPAAAQVVASTPEVIAAMRADVHRKAAELIEARAASQPDVAKIEKLALELQDLRLKCRGIAPLPVADATVAPATAWDCLFGGPGSGLGQGRQPGYGPGYGLGRGNGPGRGYGRGMGMGRCATLGCCPWGAPGLGY